LFATRIGVAGLLDVVGGRLGSELGAEHALPRQVEVTRVLEHRAGHDLAEPLPLQREAGDEPVQRRGEHVLVGGMCVRAVRAGKRDAVAAHDDGGSGGRDHVIIVTRIGVT
jgi:hypothetical protein